MTRRLSLLLAVVLAFGLVSLAAAQQQDQPNATPNPLVQLLQNKGVLTPQEAAAINQAPTPGEQQNRLTQLLYSKGIITQDEYQTAAAAQASRTWNSQGQGQGMWIETAAHSSAGEPDAAVAAAPQAPPAPAVIPAVAPVRVLQSEPPKAGGIVPDIRLGSGAKMKLYGFIKSTSAYDTSNPYNIDFVLPGLDNVVAPTFPTSIPTQLNSTTTNLFFQGIGGSAFGPNGSPTFWVKATATRFGSNFEWPDIAGSRNTFTGRIEADFEGNFSRSQNRNVSSASTRMVALRLAWGRLDHEFSDKTTGFLLFGQDWTPFASSIQPNLLETTGGAGYFGVLQRREAQIRLGLWHDFGGSSNIKIGIEPALGLPAFGNNSTDVGTQLGVGERQGTDSARPDIMGRVVFQWQLDKAKGVAPAQIIISGDAARDVQLVSRQALVDAVCPTAGSLNTAGVITTGAPLCVDSNPAAQAGLLQSYPNGLEPGNQRWGATAGFQLPTRYATLVAQYYTGADLKWYAGTQVYSFFNDNTGLLLTNGAGGAICNVGASSTNAGGCPIAFNVDASATTGGGYVPFGYNSVTGQWQVIPQKPMRGQGGFSQLSFPLSRIFDANPAGRNAGWTIAFAVGLDEAKGRDVRVAQPSGGRSRADFGAATLNWRINQYATFAYELSLYRSFTTCDPVGWTGTPGANPSTGTSASGLGLGGVPGPNGGLICTGTPYIAYPLSITNSKVNEGAPFTTNGAARAWHDLRNEFGPVFTF